MMMHRYVSYWVFPVVSAIVWLIMLLVMLLVWVTEGSPHYDSMTDNQRIAYISDIGAQGLKPLFITGSVIMTLTLDMAFLSERWLRHRGRLAKNTTTGQKVLVGLSIFFAFIGTLGLILLSIFDTLRHPTLHRLFLLFFIGGYILSAVFTCWEYQRLGIHFREHRILRISFWIKLAFILVEFILAIAFGAMMYKGSANVAAVLEWVISLIFTFYTLSFFLDLFPAVHTRGGQKETEIEKGAEESTPGSRHNI